MRHQVAWFVAKIESDCGTSNPLPYQAVDVNDGGAWQSKTSQAIIPLTGLYYLHLEAVAHYKRTMQVLVTVNNATTLFTLNEMFASQDVEHNRGMGDVVRLMQGDRVIVALPPGNYCISMSSFNGLLITIV